MDKILIYSVLNGVSFNMYEKSFLNVFKDFMFDYIYNDMDGSITINDEEYINFSEKEKTDDDEGISIFDVYRFAESILKDVVSKEVIDKYIYKKHKERFLTISHFVEGDWNIEYSTTSEWCEITGWSKITGFDITKEISYGDKVQEYKKGIIEDLKDAFLLNFKIPKADEGFVVYENARNSGETNISEKEKWMIYSVLNTLSMTLNGNSFVNFFEDLVDKYHNLEYEEIYCGGDDNYKMEFDDIYGDSGTELYDFLFMCADVLKHVINNNALYYNLFEYRGGSYEQVNFWRDYKNEFNINGDYINEYCFNSIVSIPIKGTDFERGIINELEHYNEMAKMRGDDVKDFETYYLNKIKSFNESFCLDVCTDYIDEVWKMAERLEVNDEIGGHYKLIKNEFNKYIKKVTY